MCAVVVDGVCVSQRRHVEPPHERVVVVALEEAQPERVEQHERHALAAGKPALDLAGDVGERPHQAANATRRRLRGGGTRPARGAGP